MKFDSFSRFARSLTLTAALLALLTPSVWAGGIGYVDARRLIDDAPQGQSEAAKLEAAFAERTREIKGRFDLFKSKEDDLEKNRMLMSPEELTEKTDELREMQRQLQREQREYNEDLTARRNQGLAKLERLITEVIIEVAKREELDIVFQQAVYASENIDLTPMVLEELQKRFEQ